MSQTMIRVSKELRDELLILRVKEGKASIEEYIRQLIKQSKEDK